MKNKFKWIKEAKFKESLKCTSCPDTLLKASKKNNQYSMIVAQNPHITQSIVDHMLSVKCCLTIMRLQRNPSISEKAREVANQIANKNQFGLGEYNTCSLCTEDCTFAKAKKGSSNTIQRRKYE